MTGGEQALSARIEELPQGSLRRRALEGARRFKSAWVEFARLLSEVRRSGHWKEWGYGSFESYCAKELFIRKQTAEKLTLSYGFLERHEPSMVRSQGEAKAPPFELIEVLSRAEAAGRLSEAGYREVRDKILERPPTAAAMNRWIAERSGPEPVRSEPAPARLERLVSLARRLAAACEGEEEVPRGVAQRARVLAGDLEQLVGK